MQFRKSVKKESKLWPRIASRPQYFLWVGPAVLGNITRGVFAGDVARVRASQSRIKLSRFAVPLFQIAQQAFYLLLAFQVGEAIFE